MRLFNASSFSVSTPSFRRCSCDRIFSPYIRHITRHALDSSTAISSSQSAWRRFWLSAHASTHASPLSISPRMRWSKNSISFTISRHDRANTSNSAATFSQDTHTSVFSLSIHAKYRYCSNTWFIPFPSDNTASLSCSTFSIIDSTYPKHLFFVVASSSSFVSCFICRRIDTNSR